MTFGVLNLYKLFLRSTVPTPPSSKAQRRDAALEGRALVSAFCLSVASRSKSLGDQRLNHAEAAYKVRWNSKKNGDFLRKHTYIGHDWVKIGHPKVGLLNTNYEWLPFSNVFFFFGRMKPIGNPNFGKMNTHLKHHANLSSGLVSPFP